MNEEWMIDVAGVSAGGWQAETEELVMRAELIVAGQRILDMITRRDVEKIPLDASALRNLERQRRSGRSFWLRAIRFTTGSAALCAVICRKSACGFIRIRPRFRNFLRNWWFRGRMRLCSVCMGKKLCRGGESSAQSWP